VKDVFYELGLYLGLYRRRRPTPRGARITAAVLAVAIVTGLGVAYFTI
jgi:hypothetical protein